MRLTIITLLVIICHLCQNVSSLAVMSVDLGSEWMKIAVVAPGIPMEIVLNKESKRKTPTAISFRNEERSFGEDALNVGVRFPKFSYQYILDLIGKDINNPIVKLYQERFPYYKIIADENRNTVLFQHDDETFYSPEELLSQILKKAKEFAEVSVGQPIKDCVITVPGFFNQVERTALIQAAELADLKVLQLINDYTAVALNYAIFNQKSFNETSQNILFYDMGASKTTAAIVKFQTVKNKEHRFVETLPSLQVLGVGYDRTLGGLEMTLRLRDFLAKNFEEDKKLKTSIFKNDRALSKVFKEAQKLKTILSANNEYLLQIESLFEDKDFKMSIKREFFENLIGDLLERVHLPVEKALKNAQLTMDEISQVILIGAGTRVPKVQENLQKYVKKDLAKNMNFDESAAMGAIYKGAELSTGFQVKKILVKDAILTPIQINFERDQKRVQKQLFGINNVFPQKKILTLHKFTTDFEFYVNFGPISNLETLDFEALGSKNISKISITGVTEALKKYSDPNYDFKGVKSHFTFSESGILNLTLTEAIFEKTVLENDEINFESTFSKLGSTISKLFSSGTENTESEKTEKENETVDKNESENSKNQENNSDELNNNSEGSENGKKRSENVTEGSVDPKVGQNDSKTPNLDKKQGNEGAENSTSSTKKEKIVTVKEILAADIVPAVQNMPKTMSEPEFDTSKSKIVVLDRIDYEKTRRETALNSLETLLIDIKTKFENPDFEKCASEAEKVKILAESEKNLEWLYDEGSDATFEVYEKKFLDFQKLIFDVNSRFWEQNERPDAIEALKKMLGAARQFYENSKNFTGPENVFTDLEITNLDKIITETENWLEKSISEQKALKSYEPPILTVKILTEKMSNLDREVKYLVNKLKNFRPKTEKPKAEKSDKKSEKSEKSEKSDKKSDKKTEKSEKLPENSENTENEVNNENLEKNEFSGTENLNSEKILDLPEKSDTENMDEHSEL